jgi:plasmid maintenance system antidote protein VapI
MTIYYIYEIPGVKVGCTKNLKSRVEQRQKTPLGKYKVLGAANNIKDASEMEQEWQIKLGYSTDKGYDKVLKMQQKSQTSEAKSKRMSSMDFENRNFDYKNRNFDYKNRNINYQSFQKQRVEKKQKPVIQSKNGQFIKEWESATQAANVLNIHQSNITNCCNKKYGYKTAGGFEWTHK